jgi:hypothetical protein
MCGLKGTYQQQRGMKKPGRKLLALVQVGRSELTPQSAIVLQNSSAAFTPSSPGIGNADVIPRKMPSMMSIQVLVSLVKCMLG